MGNDGSIKIRNLDGLLLQFDGTDKSKVIDFFVEFNQLICETNFKLISLNLLSPDSNLQIGRRGIKEG